MSRPLAFSVAVGPYVNNLILYYIFDISQMISRNYFEKDLKKHQIDTLKIFNENVEEVLKNEIFKVSFMSGLQKITIKIVLGEDFPNEKPNITVEPIVTHPWVNISTGEVEKAPALLSYTLHSDLGRLVQAIIREFEKIPNDLCCKSTIPENKTISLSTINFPELSELSLEQLQKLNEDSEFFNDFVEEISILQNLNNKLDATINEVDSVARENFSKQDNLNEIKLNINTDLSMLKKLGEEYEELIKIYNNKIEQFDLQHIRELLQIAVSTADCECEIHVEKFLHGDIDTQTFLGFYMNSKKISALRKAKEEQLAKEITFKDTK